MIPRDKYLGQLIMSMGNGFPKIVTGIRRCGKSYLLKEIFKSHLICLCQRKGKRDARHSLRCPR